MNVHGVYMDGCISDVDGECKSEIIKVHMCLMIVFLSFKQCMKKMHKIFVIGLVAKVLPEI